MAITYERKTLFNGRVEFVPIKFQREWMGNPKGSKMIMSRRQADILANRGTVKILDGEPGKDNKLTLRKRKAMTSPPSNKMVEEAEMVK